MIGSRVEEVAVQLHHLHHSGPLWEDDATHSNSVNIIKTALESYAQRPVLYVVPDSVKWPLVLIITSRQGKDVKKRQTAM